MKQPLKLIQDLKARGIRPGICVDGYTEPGVLSDEVLKAAEQVLLMSVKAGFGGQSFMPEVVDKIKSLRSRGYKGEIEVDGGIVLENVGLLAEAGADIVVSGSFIMKKPKTERAEIIRAFQEV